jgi:alkylated DNA repair dioxygenase AlkB
MELPVAASRSLPVRGADLTYYPGFFPAGIPDLYFRELRDGLQWQQVPIVLFGKRMLQPRLVAWYGDPGVTYRYSGASFKATGWLDPLDAIRAALLRELGINFNSVLCNRYRDGRDSMGWHSDDEPELGARPKIASVSFGAERPFHLRAKDRQSTPVKLNLGHGSVLLMAGETQRNWQHSLPKLTRNCGERINLTFRQLAGPGGHLA